MFAAVLRVQVQRRQDRVVSSPVEFAAHRLGAAAPLPGLGSAAKWGGRTCGTKAWLPEGDRMFLF